jgi:hypothetical protein
MLIQPCLHVQFLLVKELCIERHAERLGVNHLGQVGANQIARRIYGVIGNDRAAVPRVHALLQHLAGHEFATSGGPQGMDNRLNQCGHWHDEIITTVQPCGS